MRGLFQHDVCILRAGRWWIKVLNLAIVQVNKPTYKSYCLSGLIGLTLYTYASIASEQTTGMADAKH